MLVPCLLRRPVLTVPLVFVAALLLMEPARSDQEAGTAIPAESRPCVDCHAFEFMQRALQDLKKTAYNLDTRTETLLLQVEKRNLCDCVTANLLNWIQETSCITCSVVFKAQLYEAAFWSSCCKHVHPTVLRKLGGGDCVLCVCSVWWFLNSPLFSHHCIASKGLVQ